MIISSFTRVGQSCYNTHRTLESVDESMDSLANENSGKYSNAVRNEKKSEPLSFVSITISGNHFEITSTDKSSFVWCREQNICAENVPEREQGSDR